MNRAGFGSVGDLRKLDGRLGGVKNRSQPDPRARAAVAVGTWGGAAGGEVAETSAVSAEEETQVRVLRVWNSIRATR